MQRLAIILLLSLSIITQCTSSTTVQSNGHLRRTLQNDIPTPSTTSSRRLSWWTHLTMKTTKNSNPYKKSKCDYTSSSEDEAYGEGCTGEWQGEDGNGSGSSNTSEVQATTVSSENAAAEDASVGGAPVWLFMLATLAGVAIGIALLSYLVRDGSMNTFFSLS